MATGVETVGVDLRTRTTQLGAKCEVRFLLVKNRIFQKSYMVIGLKKLLRTGLVPARAMTPTERLKSGRQMAAAAAGKKESVSLSLFMEVNNLVVEEELSTMATLAWAEGSRMGRLSREQTEARRKHIFQVQAWEQVRGLAVMCENRDLGIKCRIGTL